MPSFVAHISRFVGEGEGIEGGGRRRVSRERENEGNLVRKAGWVGGWDKVDLC